MNDQDRHSEQLALTLLKECGAVLVALSGGVDSALLLALAAEALGPESVLAATTYSAAVPPQEVETARLVAQQLGVRHETVATRELLNPDYQANRGDRCFHCRSEMFGALRDHARDRGFPTVVYGAIVDDLGDFRPGMRAAENLGIRAPLLEAGLDKQAVRRLARSRALTVSEKPAEACLSSRVPVGTVVTPQRLARIGRAEDALHALGFGQLRVRDHGDVARLELDPAGNRALENVDLRSRVIEAVQRAGFRYVAVDLQGYRSGSLNARVDPAVCASPRRSG